MTIKIKRAYSSSDKADGFRVLIDRLWPRGIKKKDLALDDWFKDLAPSTELRKEFGHDPKKWKEFQAKYRREIQKSQANEKLDALAKRARRGTVTLIYSARDEKYNDAVVLKKILDRKIA
jgi:uncharacterized protein YeaO (DUF488 family)